MCSIPSSNYTKKKKKNSSDSVMIQHLDNKHFTYFSHSPKLYNAILKRKKTSEKTFVILFNPSDKDGITIKFEVWYFVVFLRGSDFKSK